LLVDGSSDGLSSSSLFSNFFASAQRHVRILATFPGSGFAEHLGHFQSPSGMSVSGGLRQNVW